MPSLSVVLVEPENAVNVGMIARVMRNFDFSDLRIVRPMFSSFRRAYSAAMRARDLLIKAKICSTVEEALRGIDLSIGTTGRIGSSSSIVRRGVELSRYLKELSWDANYAVLMGRESTGLRREELDRCDVIATIRTNPEYPTLNVVNAVAIILYEFSKKLGQLELSSITPVSDGTAERMLNYISEVLSHLALPEHKRRRAFALIRRLIKRAYPCGVAESEAEYLLGVLRRIRDGLAGV